MRTCSGGLLVRGTTFVNAPAVVLVSDHRGSPIACCIEYSSKGSGGSSAAGIRPNSSKVCASGEAVNAKYEMFGADAAPSIANWAQLRGRFPHTRYPGSVLG